MNYESSKTSHFFWGILYFFSVFAVLKCGGRSPFDFFAYALVVSCCCLILLMGNLGESIPRSVIVLSCCLVILLIIQIVPLPGLLFKWLSPIKYGHFNHMQAIIPELKTIPSIAVSPQAHMFHGLALVVDLVLFVLLLLAPRPGKRLFFLWLSCMSIGYFVVTWMKDRLVKLDISNPFLDQIGPYGGFFNANHSASFVLIVGVGLGLFAFLKVSELSLLFEKGESVGSKKAVVTVLSKLALALILLIVIFWYFGNLESRSGILILVIIFTALFFLGACRAMLNFSARRSFGVVLVFLLLALLLGRMDFHKGVGKLREKGLNVSERVDYLRIGLGYLKQGPVLGVGLGSSGFLLDPFERRAAYLQRFANHFHNEFVQICLELGFVGTTIFFLLLIVSGWHLFGLINFRSPSARVFLVGAGLVVLVVLVHSAFSFPLRKMGYRVFFLVELFALMKFAGKERHEKHQFRPWMVACFGCVIGCALFFYGYSDRYRRVGPDGYAALLVRSGHGYAAEHAQSALSFVPFSRELVQISKQDALAQLDDWKDSSLSILKENPFEIRVLNFFLVCDVLEAHVLHDGLDQEMWLNFREKAERVRDIFHDANFRARTMLFYTLSINEPNLNEHDKQLLEDMRLSLDYFYRKPKVDYEKYIDENE